MKKTIGIFCLLASSIANLSYAENVTTKLKTETLQIIPQKEMVSSHLTQQHSNQTVGKLDGNTNTTDSIAIKNVQNTNTSDDTNSNNESDSTLIKNVQVSNADAEISNNKTASNDDTQNDKVELGIIIEDLDSHLVQMLSTLNNSFILQSYKADFITDSVKLNEAISMFLPQISAETRYQYASTNNQSYNTSWTPRLQLSMNLFKKGVDKYKLMQTYYYVLGKSHEYHYRVREYVNKAIKIYTRLQLLLLKKSNAEKILKRYSRINEYITMKGKLNEIKKIDVYQFNIEYEKQKLQYEKIKLDITSTLAQYREIYSYDDKIDFSNFNNELIIPNVNLNKISNAIPTIVSENSNRQKTLMDVEATYYKHYAHISDKMVFIPNIDFDITAEKNIVYNEGKARPNSDAVFSTALSLKFPISNIWHRNTKDSLSELQSSIYKLKYTHNKLYKEISNIVDNIKLTNTMLESYLSILEDAQQTLESIEILYTNKAINLKDFISITNQYNSYFAEYMSIQEQQLNNIYTLITQTVVVDQILKKGDNYFDPFLYLDNMSFSPITF